MYLGEIVSPIDLSPCIAGLRSVNDYVVFNCFYLVLSIAYNKQSHNKKLYLNDKHVSTPKIFKTNKSGDMYTHLGCVLNIAQ